MPERIEIVLPGLFDLPLAELPRESVERDLPNLNRILRFGKPRPNHAYSVDTMLRRALGWSIEASVSLPMAQAFAPDEEREQARHILCEPVHLHPDLRSAVIVPIEKNADNLTDITILINRLNELFKVDCDMSAVAEGVFLLRLENLHAPQHYPHILSVLGKTANPYIEQSRADLPWYRLLNEMQMFMHQHEVNQRRQRRGLLPINSLWCWGGGNPPAPVDRNLAWYCDDPLLNGFARSVGLDPVSVDQIEAGEIGGEVIIVDLRLLEGLKTGQAVALDQLLVDIERQILAPLSPMRSARLRLRGGFNYDFCLDPGAGMRFWRRRKSLLDWRQPG